MAPPLAAPTYDQPYYTYRAPVAPTPVTAPAPKVPGLGIAYALKATLIATCLVMLGGLTEDSNYSGMSTSFSIGWNIGRTMGMVLAAGAMALVVSLFWSAIMALFKRRFGDSLARGYAAGIVTIALIASASSLLVSARLATQGTGVSARKAEKEATKEFVQGMESDMKTVVAEISNADGRPKKTRQRFENTGPATNDQERLRKLMQSYFNEMIVLQNEYSAALEKAGISKILLPARLENDEGFRESREILFKLNEVVLQFKNRANGMITDFPKRLDSVELTSISKESIMIGFRVGSSSAVSALQENWKIELSTIALTGQLIDHLETSRKFWTVNKRVFIFQRNADLVKFNKLLADIEAGTQRQAKIREESVKKATGTIDEIKQDLVR